MKTILTALILLVSLNLFAQDPPEKYLDIWIDSQEMDRDDALKNLDALIKKNPKDPWPYWMRGIITFNGIEDGEEFFANAIKVDSSFAPAYYNLATCIEPTNEIAIKQIEFLYTKAIELNKDSEINYYFERGSFYVEQKKFDLALADAKKAKETGDMGDISINQLFVYALNGLNMEKELKQFMIENDVVTGGMYSSDYYILAGSLYEKFRIKTRACEAYSVGLEQIGFVRDLYETPEEFEKAYGEDIKVFQEKLKACN